ncbi:PTS system, glucose subfamily, IIA component [Lachnospiraceae bacterium 3-1]|nr:PTS system, glucose subfamily, IIA component [Lachnospiraceae bacterium 3-1]
MNYDYAKIAKEVIQAVGGSENIKSAAHCATRLRLIVADRSLADDEKVGEIDAVKGTFFTAGQYQIIFGTGHVNRVYEQITQLGIAETTASEAKEAKMDGKNQLQKAIRTFGDVFVPVIPALVATGLFLGLKGALLNDNFLNLFGMTNADIPQTFQVLVDVLSGTTFAFLPAIVCWSTFRVFGGSPVLGLILGLMLVNGALPNAYSVADPASGVTPLMLFGFIPIVGYQGSILPAFVAGVIGSKLEKKLRKTVPAVFDFMITPFLVLFVMLILSLLVIGPLLHALENVLLVIVEYALKLPLGIGGLIVGFFWSIITLTGVHHIFNMLEISLLASTGFNPFNAILCMCGFSSAGVCLAISIKARKKEIRAIGPSATVSALLGIGEPALFGVILRYGMKPFLLSCSINGVAGMIAMLLGMKGTGNGITTIPGMLLYIYSPSQLAMYVILALATFVTAFSLCWFFAVPPEVMEDASAVKKDALEPAPAVPKTASEPAPAPFPDVLGSAALGTFVPMEEIPDPTFAQGILGTCCGIEPETGKVYSPMDGTIVQLADTLHAVGIEAGGVELLLHVGIDTVAMNGDGFQSHITEGQTVKKGDLLLTMDLEKIKAAGHPATIMVIVTNSDDLASVEASASSKLKPGDPLMLLKA